MSLNDKIKVDTLKWLKFLKEQEIASMVVNTTFDNCNSTNEKLNQSYRVFIERSSSTRFAIAYLSSVTLPAVKWLKFTSASAFDVR